MALADGIHVPQRIMTAHDWIDCYIKQGSSANGRLLICSRIYDLTNEQAILSTKQQAAAREILDWIIEHQAIDSILPFVTWLNTCGCITCFTNLKDGDAS